MKKSYSLLKASWVKPIKKEPSQKGALYRLRVVTPKDAEFVVDLRTSSRNRDKFLTVVGGDIEAQRIWISQQSQQPDDFYFVVENMISNAPEGLISLYNVADGEAEWGRWVLVDGSPAALESAHLLFNFAFNDLGLREVYSRTLKENSKVVQFHDSLGAIRSNNKSESDGSIQKETVEHRITKELFNEKISLEISEKSLPHLQRYIFKHFPSLEFHHIGIAGESISNELTLFSLLGYRPEGEKFTDETQGIRGLFISSPGHPRLELLENLDGHGTLDVWVKRKLKAYHLAFFVDDLNSTISIFVKLGWKVTSPPKHSEYFKSDIVFLMMPNMLLIELIERCRT